MHLVLPPVVASADESPDAPTRRITDLFWNAFHHDRCPFFDAEDGFTSRAVDATVR